MVGLTAGSGLSPLPACRSALGYGFISAFAGMPVHLYVVELFPVEVRNAGVGLSPLSWPMCPVTCERSGREHAILLLVASCS